MYKLVSNKFYYNILAGLLDTSQCNYWTIDGYM